MTQRPNRFDNSSARDAPAGRRPFFEADGLRRVMFETGRVSPAQRFASWRDGANAASIPYDIQEGAGDFLGRARIFGCEDLHLNHLQAPSHHMVRGRREIALGARDTVSLMLVNRGTLAVSQSGRTAVGLAGDLVVVYKDSPFRTVLREVCDFTSVQVRADVFTIDVRSRSPLVLTARVSPLAAVAAAYMRSLPWDTAALTAMADLAASQLSALVARGVDGPPPVEAPPKRHVFDAIQAAVASEIGNPGLSSKLLADRLGLSRTALFDAVAAEGCTLADLVLTRRLTGCIGDLARAGRTETLTTISRRWGFRDLSTFTRAFKRRYGEAPTRWRAPGSAEPPRPA